MTARLLNTLKNDILLQFRQGFYYATAFLLLVWLGTLSLLPANMSAVAPAVLLTNMVVTTFFFVGGLVLLEKGQRVLEGLIVSPLRPEEYLISKIASLGLIAVVESLIIVIGGLLLGFLVGPINWFWLTLGLIVDAIVFTLLGFLMIVRYDSINEFMMPAALVIALFELPAIVYFGFPESILFYILPTQGPLLLLQQAFSPITTIQLIYALTYPTILIVIGFILSKRAYRKFVTRRVGLV